MDTDLKNKKNGAGKGIIPPQKITQIRIKSNPLLTSPVSGSGSGDSKLHWVM